MSQLCKTFKNMHLLKLKAHCQTFWMGKLTLHRDIRVMQIKINLTAYKEFFFFFPNYLFNLTFADKCQQADRVTLPCHLHLGELPIRNTEACRFNSAYHKSWSFACAGLAQRGLTSARSLWHDMSWAYACALCLVCAELLVFGVESGAAAPSDFSIGLWSHSGEKVAAPYGLQRAGPWSLLCLIGFGLKRDGLLIQHHVLAVGGLKVALSILSWVSYRATSMQCRKNQRTHTNTCWGENKEPTQTHAHSG